MERKDLCVAAVTQEMSSWSEGASSSKVERTARKQNVKSSLSPNALQNVVLPLWLSGFRDPDTPSFAHHTLFLLM